MSPVSAVQCSAVLQYSACQSCSRPVHQSPKKWKTEEEKSRKRKEGKKCVITGQNKQYAICQKRFSTSGSVCLATVWTHKQTHTQTDMATL